MYTRAQNEAAASRADTDTTWTGTSRAGTTRAGSSIRSGSTRRAETETSTIRPRRRARRNHKFPPEEYSDLTCNDLALIAAILTPKKPQESRSAYEKKIKARIAELPAHLHCKHPLLSTFCNFHSKLTPLPISSLFHTIREEIEDEVPGTWDPLAERKQLSAQKEEMVEIVQHLAVLWLGAKVFQERFHRTPRRAFVGGKPSKCSACLLVAIGGDFPTLIAMAGLFIGRVRKDVWGNSKRIQFLLEWAASRLPPSRRADGCALVWEIGRKFRITRLGAESKRGRSDKRARADSDIEDEFESEVGPGTASYAFSLDRELREEKSRGPRKLIGSSAFAAADGQAEEDFEQMWVDKLAERMQAENEEERLLRWQRHQAQKQQRLLEDRRPRSSMYSVTTSGEREGDNTRPPSISIDQELDSIISLYQDGSGQDQTDAHDLDGRYGYPRLNPYAKDERDDDGSEASLGFRPITTMSRIQSTIDRAFGKKWDGK